MTLIGILDSGVGGLSVLREVQRTLPHKDLLYVADQINLPYGPRPLEEIQQFTEGITRYLLDQGALMIVIACNTASAAALHYLRGRFPGVAFVGLEPAVRPAARDTQSKVIGVIATEATFNGELYQRLLAEYTQGVQVVARACPELVLLAERGGDYSAADYALVAELLHPMRAAGADQLVLGCTHFAFLHPLLQAALGAGATIINPAPAVGRQVERKLLELEPEPARAQVGRLFFRTTGDVENFQRQITTLLGIPNPNIAQLRWQNGVLS